MQFTIAKMVTSKFESSTQETPMAASALALKFAKCVWSEIVEWDIIQNTKEGNKTKWWSVDYHCSYTNSKW